MIVVTDIEYIEVDGHECLRQSAIDRQPFLTRTNKGEMPPPDPTMVTTVIRGDRFVNWNGEAIMLGLCEDAKDMLKLPADAFGSLHNECHRLRDQLLDKERAITDYRCRITECGHKVNAARSQVITSYIVASVFAIYSILTTAAILGA